MNRTIKLAQEPIQVTNGSNEGIVQSLNKRSFFAAHSVTKPNPNDGGAVAMIAKAHPPWVIWVWAPEGEEIEVNIQST